MSRKSPHFCLSLLLYDCARLLVQYCLSQTFLKIAVQCFLSSWSNIERKCSRPGWIVHTLYCVHFRLSSLELGLTKLNVVMYPHGWKVPWMFSCQWDCCYYKSGKLISLVTMSQFRTLAWMFYLNGHSVTILELGLDVLWGAKRDRQWRLWQTALRCIFELLGSSVTHCYLTILALK